MLTLNKRQCFSKEDVLVVYMAHLVMDYANEGGHRANGVTGGWLDLTM